MAASSLWITPYKRDRITRQCLDLPHLPCAGRWTRRAIPIYTKAGGIEEVPQFKSRECPNSATLSLPETPGTVICAFLWQILPYSSAQSKTPQDSARLL